jgi:hypothetical protein
MTLIDKNNGAPFNFNFADGNLTHTRFSALMAACLVLSMGVCGCRQLSKQRRFKTIPQNPRSQSSFDKAV